MQPTIIEKFINKEISFFLNDYFRPLAENNHAGILNVPLSNEQGFGNDYIQKNRPVIYAIVKLIIESIAHQFNLPKEKISLNRVNYQVLVAGQEIGYHSDNRGAYENTMKNEGRSALLYLDNQYVGGEIIFYEKDVNGIESSKSYHPEPGTLIYFTGNEEHCHSVNKIISGERPNIIIFYDVVQ